MTTHDVKTEFHVTQYYKDDNNIVQRDVHVRHSVDEGIFTARRLSLSNKDLPVVISAGDNSMIPQYILSGESDVYGSLRVRELWANRAYDNDSLRTVAYDEKGHRTIGDTSIAKAWSVGLYVNYSAIETHSFGVLSTHEEIMDFAEKLSIAHPEGTVSIAAFSRIRMEIINGGVVTDRTMTSFSSGVNITRSPLYTRIAEVFDSITPCDYKEGQLPYVEYSI